MAAHNGHNAQFKTVSGDLMISGTDGDVQLNTVSGDANLTLGTRHARPSGERVRRRQRERQRARCATASSTPTRSAATWLHLATVPDADIDVQSFSGDIHNCFGPKPVEEQYGPGSRLSFRSGKGGGRIHIDTKSGDVTLCTAEVTPRPRQPAHARTRGAGHAGENLHHG